MGSQNVHLRTGKPRSGTKFWIRPPINYFLHFLTRCRLYWCFLLVFSFQITMIHHFWLIPLIQWGFIWWDADFFSVSPFLAHFGPFSPVFSILWQINKLCLKLFMVLQHFRYYNPLFLSDFTHSMWFSMTGLLIFEWFLLYFLPKMLKKED